MAKQRRLYNGQKICWVPGFLEKFENRRAVLDTPGGLCPTGGGKPRWLRLSEFIGHRLNVLANKKTQQFIAGDLLQFHWMLIRVFAKRDLYGGLLNLLLGKENIPIVNVSDGKNWKVGGSSTSLKTWVHERSTMVTAKLEWMH